MLAVIQEAYLKGVSTRKVDDLVKALGLTGIDKSKSLPGACRRVSRICKELDLAVAILCHRQLQKSCSYVWLDATYLKVRQNHRIVNLALMIAVGVEEQGERHLLGFDLGGSENESFWRAFLRSLVQGGLERVQLGISDAHEGLKKALQLVFTEASWQRCKGGVVSPCTFMRNLRAKVPHRDNAAVAAAARLIFDQPSLPSAQLQLQRLVDKLERTYPVAARLLGEAEADMLTYITFPKAHWRRIHSINPLEQLHREVKRRTNGVGIFPDRPSVIRLVGSFWKEKDDDWRAASRRYFSEKSMQVVTDPDRANGDDAIPFLVELTTDLPVEA